MRLAIDAPLSATLVKSPEGREFRVECIPYCTPDGEKRSRNTSDGRKRRGVSTAQERRQRKQSIRRRRSERKETVQLPNPERRNRGPATAGRQNLSNEKENEPNRIQAAWLSGPGKSDSTSLEWSIVRKANREEVPAWLRVRNSRLLLMYTGNRASAVKSRWEEALWEKGTAEKDHSGQ